jgi:hypothetical protein
MQAGKSSAVRLAVNLDLAPGPMGIEEDEQIGGPVAPVLAIVALKLTRPGRHRRPHLADELDRALVEADHWAARIRRFGIEVEHVLHAGAVMDMWKPFRLAKAAHAPRAGDFVRQVPHIMRHLGEALDEGSQERIWAACGARSALHQGPEIHIAVAQGESHARWQEGFGSTPPISSREFRRLHSVGIGALGKSSRIRCAQRFSLIRSSVALSSVRKAH